ncbi:MAG: hypothetical protein EOL97_16535, partial [Spirochaetia bacterium]|nr:hypothetical protein [Spirochaetia bacterium]
GLVIKDTFLCNGTVNHPYITTYAPVISIESVLVDGLEYKKEDFIDILGLERVYRVEYDNDFRAKIIFGDGIYGINPLSNSKIEVTYNVSEGLNSNTDIYTINTVNSSIYDSENNLVSISVTNVTAANGGDDEEEIEEVRRNAPSVFRTQWRAVTKQDFKDLILAESGVGKVIVMDHTDINNIGIYGVKIAAIAEDGGYLDNGLKNKIMNMLEIRRLLTTHVELIKPDIVPIDIDITITKDSNYSTSLIVNNIKSVISDYLTWKNRDFDENVSAMDIYKIINSVNGVTFADNLVIKEKRNIYVNSSHVEGSTIINVVDTLNMLEKNMYITILNNEGNFVHTSKIINIDGSNITLANPLTSNISFGYYIYPIISLTKKIEQNDKKIIIDKNINNISDCIICFGDNFDKQYIVRYRSITDLGEESLALAEPMDRDITIDTNIYIIGKDASPRLEINGIKGVD